MIESKLLKPRIATVDSCFDLVWSRQRGVASYLKYSAGRLISIYSLRWWWPQMKLKSKSLPIGQCHMQNAWQGKIGKIQNIMSLLLFTVQKIRHDLVGVWVTELTLLICSQFSLQSNCHKMLWLYIDKSQLQSRVSAEFYGNSIRRTLYRGISVYPYRVWLVMTCFCLCLCWNWNLDPRNKFHAIPQFSTGSFVVQFGDHFRSGDHLRRCTILTTSTESNYSRKRYKELLKQLKTGRTKIWNVT